MLIYSIVPESRVPAGGDDLAKDWGFLVKQSVGHLIVLVGLVGNCLSFVVMKSKALRNKSYSHYLWSVVYIQPVVVLFIAVSAGRSVRLASRFAVMSLLRCCSQRVLDVVLCSRAPL